MTTNKAPSLAQRRANKEAAAVRAIAPTAKLDPTALFRRWVQETLEMAQARLGAFSKALAEDPAHAMEWADKHYTSAADVRVMRAALHAMDKGSSLEQVRVWSQEGAMAAVRYPARSTSPSSNLMAQETGAAWARVLDRLAAYLEA